MKAHKKVNKILDEKIYGACSATLETRSILAIASAFY